MMVARFVGPWSLDVTVESNTRQAECDAYVAAHPDATAYHRPAWLDLIGRVFRHRTRYLVATSRRGVVGVLPLVLFRSALFGRFAVSLPFVNYGGVLASGPEEARALVDAAVMETMRAGGRHLELRHTARLCPTLMPREHKVAMRLALRASVDAQWEQLDRKVRNQVRKAEKCGLEARSGGAELVSQFYDVFAHNMRDLGTPVYTERFFRDVALTFPDTTRVFVVTSDGRPVAASVVHWHRRTIEVPWASALREFNTQCANTLLYWAMIRDAVERGFGTFDFGRSTPGEGTFHFKRQWGAEPLPLVWEYWTRSGRIPDLSPKNPRFGTAIRAWQRLPVGVTRTLGPFIVRNIP